MNKILKKIETPYVDAQTLLSFLSDYARPRERIRRMVINGELIRLKNGFYLIVDKIHQGEATVIPYEQVANLLYGPSYVSLDWALSFYGMIPERVHTVTSMALGRDKEFHTPVGDFAYYRLNSSSYSIGIEQKKSSDFVGGFLIACPEKALADLVFKQCKGMDKEQIRLALVESKRINLESLRTLNREMLSDIEKAYRSKRVSYLVDIIGLI
jgi:predicted transcriptional regulator of viral defense system